MTRNPVDLEQALLDPAAVFRTPAEIPRSSVLTRRQKGKMLRRWEYDAHSMEVAEEENMGGGQTSDILDRILNALHALDAGPNLFRDAESARRLPLAALLVTFELGSP